MQYLRHVYANNFVLFILNWDLAGVLWLSGNTACISHCHLFSWAPLFPRKDTQMHHHLQFYTQGFQVLLLRAKHFVIFLLARVRCNPRLGQQGHHFLKRDPQWHSRDSRKGTWEVPAASVFLWSLPLLPTSPPCQSYLCETRITVLSLHSLNHFQDSMINFLIHWKKPLGIPLESFPCFISCCFRPTWSHPPPHFCPPTSILHELFAASHWNDRCHASVLTGPSAWNSVFHLMLLTLHSFNLHFPSVHWDRSPVQGTLLWAGEAAWRQLTGAFPLYIS